MPITNFAIASVFDELADLLEIEGANPFRIRAYRNASRLIANHPEPIAAKVKKDEDLSNLPGIGKDLAGKIREIVETGTLALLKDEESKIPPGLAALLKIQGIGPKRVKALRDRFGISTVADLRRVALDGRIQELEGFGPKLEKVILEDLQRKEDVKPRLGLLTAGDLGEPLLRFLEQIPGVKKAIIAGSYRRRMETVGDLDILVTCTQGSLVMKRFVQYEDVSGVLARGPTRSAILLKSGLQVDLRVVPEASYGSALLYFTGSKQHNIAVRAIALKKKYKLNEYGLFKGSTRIAGKTEEDVYARIGLPFIEPELRENRGEIEAALSGSLPKLIKSEDIRGDLHAHTNATDGKLSLEEMAEAAMKLGYEYLAITDHTRHLSVTRGLDPSRLKDQIRKIDRLNERYYKQSKNFQLLKGSEVDILENGALDLPDSILKELDVRVCSLHYKFNLNKKKQTERVLRAMDNRNFNILAHPTGRLIGRREGYEIDTEALMAAAKERGCFMELNAQPERLDLTDTSCKAAKAAGVRIAVSTDAHNAAELRFMSFGIAQARRGWLEAKDVLNTQSREKLLKTLRRR